VGEIRGLRVTSNPVHGVTIPGRKKEDVPYATKQRACPGKQGMKNMPQKEGEKEKFHGSTAISSGPKTRRRK